MPQVINSADGNLFVFDPNEYRHPILDTIIAGNLERFLLAINNVNTVMMGQDALQLTCPGHLYLWEREATTGRTVIRNIAWLAAHYRRYHLLQFIFENVEELGLHLGHFIPVVDMANQPNSPNPLRHFVEGRPEMIAAYNQIMPAHRQFQFL